MNSSEPTLLLVRAEAQSKAFLSQVEARLDRSIPSHISPVLRIDPVGKVPDLDWYRTVIFTSANAVSRVADKLTGVCVVTVGQKTAVLASSFGANARCLGETVEDLLSNISSIEGPAIYLHGVHTRGDLVKNAAKHGIKLRERVIYDQAEQKLTADAQRLLASGTAVVPLFSPRTARLVSQYHCDAQTRILAISQATANDWRASGVVEIAARPEADAMLELVEKVM